MDERMREKFEAWAKPKGMLTESAWEAWQACAAALSQPAAAINAELRIALQHLFNSYKSLADSGDAGNWRLEEQPEGIRALAALSKAAA